MRLRYALAIVVAVAALAGPGAAASPASAADGAREPVGAMEARRARHAASSLAGPAEGESAAPATDGWTPTSPLVAARHRHTATPLPDGRVLVVGGFAPPTDLAASEVYDPATARWVAVAPLATPRGGHTATLLPDGRVLVVGGLAGGESLPRRALATTELYDPATGRWSLAAALASTRSSHTATLLHDGRVLVVGGLSAELYDPVADRWVPAAALGAARNGHTATLLPDGRVLVAGGFAPEFDPARAYNNPYALATTERYDPATDRWTPAGAMQGARSGHTATLLPDGRVLVAGGTTYSRNGRGNLIPQAISGVERYDPAADRWAVVAPLTQGRTGHTATALPDGGVLVVGGNEPRPSSVCNDVRSLATTERYDLATDRWAAVGVLNDPRIAHTASPLPGGHVLVVGGINQGGYCGSALPLSAPAELSAPLAAPDPPAGERRCFAETGFCVAGRFLAYWEVHGGLAIHGFPISDPFTETLEDGRLYTVQYFERSRFEHHPENAPPHDVLLGQFGRRIRAAEPPAPSYEASHGTRYFPETGHNLCCSFLAYWAGNGGLEQFGYPIGEERRETLEDGNSYTVQYFERARFEYHPEHRGTPYEVLLGQFGRRIYEERRR